jgi:hypothetical protein
MKVVFLATMLIFSVPSFGEEKAKGLIFLSCASCTSTIYSGYTSRPGKWCTVINYFGIQADELWGCRRDETQSHRLEIILLNQVSRGQKECNIARKEYADRSCGELGSPNCALF